MKSYGELKAGMETIQQQMAEANNNERASAPKEVKRLALQLECLKVRWLKGGRLDEC